MRTIIIACFACLMTTFYQTGSAQGQITIDQNDMPSPGDTLRVSQSINIPSGFETAGTNQVWDFSSLQPAGQRVESFISATATPSAYQFFFVIIGGANMAAPVNIPVIPGFPVSDPYAFFRKSTSAYQDLGTAFTIQGFPVPARYDLPDDLYKFPLLSGNTWDSRSAFEVPVPNLAYLSVVRERSSHADGWGILTTPYGTFQTVRVKSEVAEEDSIYVDSISNGFKITRNYTEYKWLAKGEGIPVLTVTKEGALVTAVYRDIPRQITPGISRVESTAVSISPNPARETVCVNIPSNSKFKWMIIRSYDGRLVMNTSIPHDKSRLELSIVDWSTGLYFISLGNDTSRFTTRLVVLPH